MEGNKNRTILNVSLALGVILVLSLALYLYQRSSGTGSGAGAGSGDSGKPEDSYMKVRVYYPAGKKLLLEERTIARVFSQKKILKGALLELMKGTDASQRNVIPEDSMLLGIYIGTDGVLYLNFSEDFKRNFHGDVLDEYLMLKAIYETSISNSKVDDIRLLINDKEVDTIGGHFSSEYPLKQIVSQEIKID